jgi:Zn-dependent M32 family carboxypeptidase
MYNFKINKKQVEVISKALDLYSRIGAGQVNEILWHSSVAKKMWVKNDNLTENKMDYKIVVKMLDDIKKIIWGYKPNEHGGISMAEETDKIAYDLHQVIRYKLAWDENSEGGLTVDFQKPMRYSEEKLAKINKNSS